MTAIGEKGQRLVVAEIFQTLSQSAYLKAVGF
jgi:hypothetical protein